MRILAGPAVLCALVSLVGCSDLFGPSDEPRLTVSASPTVLAPGDTIEVRVSITNPSPMAADVESGCIALWYMLYVEEPEAVVFPGGNSICLTMMGDVTIPPGTTTKIHRGVLQYWDGTPAPAGTYRIRARSVLHGFFEDRDAGEDHTTVRIE